jgi:hypothetical protein
MTSCQVWPRRRDYQGYGLIRLNGKNVRVHRFVWEQTFGPIPVGLLVCHHCDNPPCVNPEHLFLGTHRDNILDSSRKGRLHFGAKNGAWTMPHRRASGDRHGSRTRPDRFIRWGDANPASKVTDTEADEIRLRRLGGESLKCIAERFKISEGQASRIARGISRRKTSERAAGPKPQGSQPKST